MSVTHYLRKFWRGLVRSIIANVRPILTLFIKGAINGFLWLADMYHMYKDMFFARRIFAVEIKITAS